MEGDYNPFPGRQTDCRESRAAPSQMNSRPLDLTVVIPAFNEERRLPRTLENIIAFLQSRSLQSEIIIVDDGSRDATASVADGFREKFPELRVFSNGKNRGKGFSVKRGMLEARAEFALFSDADLSTPIEEADKLLLALREQGYDVAIGSRGVDRTLIEIHQSVIREQAGIIFNHFVQWIMGIPFSDTQCGFKAFRTGKMRHIFEQQRIERFGFDPEILFLAKRNGLRVAEVPVRWAHDPATKVNVAADGIRMLFELLLIRWNALRGCYPRWRKP
jgi:dolichyl-phosphate beta-glucosyltransferase